MRLNQFLARAGAGSGSAADHLELSRLLEAKGAQEEADKESDAAVKLDPALASRLGRRDDRKAAREALEKATQLKKGGDFEALVG